MLVSTNDILIVLWSVYAFDYRIFNVKYVQFVCASLGALMLVIGCERMYY